jgi:hypothetical protein
MQPSENPFTLVTGSGSWNAILWLVALLVAWMVAWFIRSFGRPGYREGGERGKPFISGNEEPEKDAVHIRGSNLYWGFFEAMRGYYDRLKPLHTGDVGDYVLWLFGTTAVVLLLVLAY